ncbi:MAG TPA: NADH-quinone oxidoreductase subunit H, partial [Thermoanaerobaculia bacterium]|nr:NADH-quinone oxidoreductase subunit H [Thermoanaerobaculia bacterium]
ANKGMFLLAPLVMCTLSLAAWAVIPLNAGWAIADINVGILYIFAISSLGVYGVIMGGWASNSKYPFLGALRSAAQMVSYEVSIGFVIVTVLMCAGTLNLSAIVESQNTRLGILGWYWLPLFPMFVVFFISALAETNRPPFDLPEAESELVAGFHTEYSGMKFAFFMLAEYSMMIVNSCLIVTLFFGGWTLAMFDLGLTTNVLKGMGLFGGILGATIFLTKVMVFMLVYVWFRATFPRFRFDQLMDLGWKWLIPLALVNIVVTGLFILAGQERLMYWIGLGLIALTAFYLFKPRRAPEPAAPQKVVHAS